MAERNGKNAASLFVAEQYVNAFNKLARTNNTLILPSNVGDISSLVGQAMSIYSTISSSKNNPNNDNDNSGENIPSIDSIEQLDITPDNKSNGSSVSNSHLHAPPKYADVFDKNK